MLALEFQLASDVLSTAIAPTFAEIGQLAAVAAIRTALNYFLARKLARDAGRSTTRGRSRPGGPRRVTASADGTGPARSAGMPVLRRTTAAGGYPLWTSADARSGRHPPNLPLA